MEFYDFIITGNGLASLSLALHLAESPLRQNRILLLGEPAGSRSGSFHSFWSDRPGLCDEAIARSWTRARFACRSAVHDLSLGAYRYNLLFADDFRSLVDRKLSNVPSLERRPGPVDCVYDAAGQARVEAGGGKYSANWVFDGTTDPLRDSGPAGREIRRIKQVTRWEIETGRDHFDPELPTLMDFRIPRAGGTRFMQVLPLSPRRAWVVAIGFTRDMEPEEKYTGALRQYLRETLRIESYTLLAESSSAVSLSDRPMLRRNGFRILCLGAGDGPVKPSTGLAFQRAQRDSAAIVASLLQRFHPFKLPESAARYRLFDSAWLQTLAGKAGGSERLICSLLKRRPVERILRFLDEEGAWQTDWPILAALPWNTILQAALRLERRRKE